MNSADKITFSVIMPTLNSEKTLPLALGSIREQTYDQSKVEILVVDGGSTDGTVTIAKQYGAKILKNPKRKPEYAKHIGLLQAKGRYGIFMDSDEQFANKVSLRERAAFLANNKEVKNLLPAGLATPTGYSSAAKYMNTCGDAFSYFLYKIDGEDYIPSLNKKYTHNKTLNGYEYIFRGSDILPIVDAGTHTFDIKYLRSMTNDLKNLSIPVMFTVMAEETHRLGIVENDFVFHYSPSSVTSIFKKVNWKLVGNIFYSDTPAVGFSNRAKVSKSLTVRKALFLPYAASQILPFLDAIIFSAKKRDGFFMIHYFITEFIFIASLYYYLLKAVEITPAWGDYGG